MLKFELLRDQKIVILRPDGPLAETDFEQLAKAIDPIIASSGKLTGILIYTRSFPGWATFGAMLSHLRFIADHHRKIERIGAVTESGLPKIIVTSCQPSCCPRNQGLWSRSRRSRSCLAPNGT